MTEAVASPRGHFATMLSGAMDQLDISIRELSKQLGISYEHARRLQAGEILPSQLLVEKTAASVGMSVEQLQLAVQRDARKHVLPKKRAKKKAGTKPTPEAKPPVRVRITTIPTRPKGKKR